MNAKPHHILIILAIGLAFEGIMISAASGFTLGTPFVNSSAAAILLACGVVSAFGRRSRVAGLAGSLLGLTFTALIGLNSARLGYKWHDTWGWLSVPTLHSFITVGACLAAFIALWRRWPAGENERPLLPELRLAVVMLGSAGLVTVLIAVKGAVPPQAATGALAAAPLEQLARASSSPRSANPADATVSVPQQPDRADDDDATLEHDVGPIVMLAPARSESDADPRPHASTFAAAAQSRSESPPATSSALRIAAAAFFDTHGASVTGGMPATSALPREWMLADPTPLDRNDSLSRAWVGESFVASGASGLAGPPIPVRRGVVDPRIESRVAAPEVRPLTPVAIRSTRSDRRVR